MMKDDCSKITQFNEKKNILYVRLTKINKKLDKKNTPFKSKVWIKS